MLLWFFPLVEEKKDMTLKAMAIAKEEIKLEIKDLQVSTKLTTTHLQHLYLF